MGTYTRWTRRGGRFSADILGSRFDVGADHREGVVTLGLDGVTANLTPDEARMIGVRLIEAAVHADGERAIRATPDA